jgi:hypothetical protein
MLLVLHSLTIYVLAREQHSSFIVHTKSLKRLSLVGATAAVDVKQMKRKPNNVLKRCLKLLLSRVL